MIKRTWTRSLMSACALLTLSIAAAQPALAQDMMMGDDDSGDGDGDGNTTEAVLLLTALGLTVPDGKTELDDGAGKLESQMLLAPMLDDFGTKLADKIKNSISSDDKIILSAGDERFSLATLSVVENRLKAIKATLPSRQVFCPSAEPKIFGLLPGDGAGNPIDGSILGVARTITDLLKTDTKITSVELDPSDELIMNAAAAHKIGGTWIIPGSVAYNGDTVLLTDYDEIAKKLGALASTKCAKVKDSDEQKFVKGVSDSLQSLAKPGENGEASLLEQAIMLEPLRKPSEGKLKVLHFSIEATGGSIEQRSSIFTTLGLSSGIRISGGMVGSYSLTNALTGGIEKTGTFYCRSPIRSFGDTHRKKNDEGEGCTVM